MTTTANPYMQIATRDQNATVQRLVKRHGELTSCERTECEIVCRFADGTLKVLDYAGKVNAAAQQAIAYRTMADGERERAAYYTEHPSGSGFAWHSPAKLRAAAARYDALAARWERRARAHRAAA